MVIYLDTNVYCRPFDNQNQPRIREETDVFQQILDEVKRGEVVLVSSDILVYEVKNIFRPFKRAKIESYLSFCQKHVEETEETKEVAFEIRDNCGVKDRDALHLASAILADARIFVTCDDKVTSRLKTNCVEKMARKLERELQVINIRNYPNLERR